MLLVNLNYARLVRHLFAGEQPMISGCQAAHGDSLRVRAMVDPWGIFKEDTCNMRSSAANMDFNDIYIYYITIIYIYI